MAIIMQRRANLPSLVGTSRDRDADASPVRPGGRGGKCDAPASRAIVGERVAKRGRGSAKAITLQSVSLVSLEKRRNLIKCLPQGRNTSEPTSSARETRQMTLKTKLRDFLADPGFRYDIIVS